MDEFKISTHRQLRMFRFGLISIIIMIPIVIFYEFLTDGFILIDYALIIGLLAAVGYILTPILIIHINYVSKNKKLKFQIDKTRYKFISDKETIEFDDTEIIEAVLTKGIYYKSEIDKSNRWKMSWSDYGYLRLQIKGFDKFIYLTSIMIDIQNPPINNFKTTYKLFPIVDNDLHPDKHRSEFEENQRGLINDFKTKFENKSKTDLLEIIDNEDNFQREAVIAAKELLNK